MSSKLVRELFKPYTIYDAQLFNCDVYNIRMWEGLYFYNQLPMFCVDLVGIISQYKRTEKVINFCIDDGTAVIKCCYFIKKNKEKPNPHKWTKDFQQCPNLMKTATKMCSSKAGNLPLDIGVLVNVKGRIRDSSKGYPGETCRELVCNWITILENPMLEVSSKLERLELHARYYELKFPWDEFLELEMQDNFNSVSCKALNLIRERDVQTFDAATLSEIDSSDFNDQVIDSVLDDLLTCGFAYKDHLENSKYQIVEKNSELQEFIKDYIKSHTADKGEGIRTVLIYRHLKNNFLYRNMTMQALKHCLKLMVFNNALTSTDSKEDCFIVP